MTDCVVRVHPERSLRHRHTKVLRQVSSIDTPFPAQTKIDELKTTISSPAATFGFRGG